jgi:hypothetical protein
LEKNPDQRFQAASDLGYALEALSDSGGFPIIPSPVTGPRLRKWLLAGAAGALIAAAIGILLARHRTEDPPLQLEASILPPPGDGFWANLTRPAAISPNGASLALIAMGNGHTELWVRRLNSTETEPIAGTEDASNPFWSPDSRYIGFFAGGKLKKVDASGGNVIDICQAGLFGMGGAWSPRGVIVFAAFASPLRSVSENGGIPELISSIPLTNGAIGQYWPVFLPDGKHFLFLDWRYPSVDRPDNFVWIASLDGEKARPLPLDSTSVQYGSGHLLFIRDSDLFAQSFDLAKNELTGQAYPLVRNVEFESFIQDGVFTVSANGSLVYGTSGTGVDTELTWMDRSGRSLSVLGEAAQHETQAISPDGKRVAVASRPARSRETIWMYDTDLCTRVPIEAADSGSLLYSPRWSPDGRQVAYRGLG